MHLQICKRVLSGLRLTVFLGCLLLNPVMGAAEQNSDLLKQAQTYEDQQNFSTAESIHQRVLVSYHGNIEALKHLSILEQTDLKLNESIEHFKRELAEIYQELNQPAKRQSELDLVKKLSQAADAKLPEGTVKESRSGKAITHKGQHQY